MSDVFEPPQSRIGQFRGTRSIDPEEGILTAHGKRNQKILGNFSSQVACHYKKLGERPDIHNQETYRQNLELARGAAGLDDPRSTRGALRARKRSDG